jgi:hypothetical protein
VHAASSAVPQARQQEGKAAATTNCAPNYCFEQYGKLLFYPVLPYYWKSVIL